VTPSTFGDRYGEWALIAGASEGIGAAFAEALAARGLSLILVARRPEPLAALAARLPTPTVTVAADVATDEGRRAVDAAAEGREVGLVVANAAYSPIGGFLTLTPEQTRRALDLNCGVALDLAHRFLPAMVQRGRGGFIVMSSLAGMQGFPPVTVYAATKAFGAVLAEGLWAELRGTGVDVLACVAGAVTTPGLASAMSNRAPGTMTPDKVVAATLRRLGSGPRTIPGAVNRIASVVMSRLLPKRAAIAIFARSSRDLSSR
jgi:uncharacterized protein